MLGSIVDELPVKESLVGEWMTQAGEGNYWAESNKVPVECVCKVGSLMDLTDDEKLSFKQI